MNSQNEIPSSFSSTSNTQLGSFSEPNLSVQSQQDSISEPVVVGSSSTTRKGISWEAWEDRALARQVLADDPLTCLRGRTPEKWLAVSVHLEELLQPIHRSADSCQSRMKKLVLLHKAQQTKSSQKTGTNEEVNQFIQDMDEVVVRWDQGSTDPEVRQEALDKARKLEEDGKIVRDASLRGLVRRSDELNEDSDREAAGRPRKKGKNEVSRRIEGVLEDIKKEAGRDAEVVNDLQEVEERHHSEVIQGLKALAEELEEDRLARRQECMDMMRIFAHRFGEGSNNNM